MDYLIPADHQDWSWVGDYAARRAQLTPDKEAIVDNIEKRRYSFAQINSRANQLARVLRDLGIEKGSRVVIYSKNRLDCIDLFFATGKIGAILVPLNIRLATQESKYLVEKTQPSVLFYDPELNPFINPDVWYTKEFERASSGSAFNTLEEKHIYEYYFCIKEESVKSLSVEDASNPGL